MSEKTKYIRHFWTFVKPYKKPLRTVYLLYFLNSLFNLLPAYSVRYYIDLVLLGNNVKTFGKVIQSIPEGTDTHKKIVISIWFLTAVIILLVIANSIGVIMWRLGTKSVESILFDIRAKIHNHINKLSLGYLNSERVGTVMTKAVGDVENVSMLLRQSFGLTYQLIHLIFAPILMILMSPVLFCVAIIPVPLIVFALINIKLKLKPMYREQRENRSQINSYIQEAITGVKEVKAFNMEQKSEKKYNEVSGKAQKLENDIMKIFSVNHQINYGAKDLGIILIAVVGGIFMISGTANITVGVLTSFIALSGFLFNPLNSLLNFYNVIQRGMVSLERIVDFLEVEHDIKDKSNARKLKHEDVNGKVEFQNVNFSYEKGNTVLENINLSINPGEKIAIVGPSGGGKSTLISMLMRFYNTDSGKILIDGIDIADCRQRSVRANIGIVFQETFLFYGTIFDNFKFVSPKSTKQQIIDACKAANIYDSILELPKKFDTRVGERGVKLSGGQKQRLAIARVFLKDPKIVILDEATSAVDTVTEMMIQESIDSMLKGRTALIIAHRLSTVRNCDKIIVLSNKTIAEAGSHDELIAQKGIYHNLHNKNEL
ncbi:MAG: ABC transporter ATP-binding protein [Kiritimatiellae bacterium]|jgi:ABC-type multidrug transport system fused ATPase/permease subunit|nr:ABC transporter ATP-binding protein [Kiritimatiellia bacterium]